MSYLFGDSERAAQRLALLARVFEPASAAFLAAAGPASAALAVDLGCGPGYTTALLARTLGCRRSVGLDASAAYVAAARSWQQGCEFLRHDVLELPYPTGPADALYARFLLSHLAEPEAAVARFASQLAPGGRLLLDEVEWIRSDAPTFRAYLERVEAVLAADAQCLFVGPLLSKLAAGDPRTRHDALRELEVDPRDAAGMFALNWATLAEHATLRARTSEAERAELATELAALWAGETGASPRITWGLRQVAFEA